MTKAIRETIENIVENYGYADVLEIIQQLAAREAIRFAANANRSINFAALDCETISLELAKLIKNIDI